MIFREIGWCLTYGLPVGWLCVYYFWQNPNSLFSGLIRKLFIIVFQMKKEKCVIHSSFSLKHDDSSYLQLLKHFFRAGHVLALRIFFD